MNEKELMSERKLLKLQPSLMARLGRAAAHHSEDANEICRRALVTELDRMDAQASVEMSRMDKLRKLAAAKGGDVDAMLEQMLRDIQEPELVLPGGDQ